MIDHQIIERKGARKVDDIPEDVLDLLNKGEVESVNLTEWLAIDHITLIEEVFPKLNITQDVIKHLSDEIMNMPKPSTMKITKSVGIGLYEAYQNSERYTEVLSSLSAHKSDAIRCYAPYMISEKIENDIVQRIRNSLGLVADTHFGVREVVWMAMRPHLEMNLSAVIKEYETLALSDNENIRRFCTESIRPRGVWCSHIQKLKDEPELVLPILELLKSDDSKYVRDSVGNWLNDASKSQPEFVEELCEKWQLESPTKETNYIIKKALRSLSSK